MNIPKPYQGNEKFIFISYSHRDTAKVFPIIFKLMDSGYRVWYDQGIDPGTEWDENIATHIYSCGYFISFMSNNYLGSSNCKDELNYARDLEKDRLIVYLEEVTLPAGMAMRVNRLQSIFRYTYVNENDFYEKLFAANNIDVCLGDKDSSEFKSEYDDIVIKTDTPSGYGSNSDNNTNTGYTNNQGYSNPDPNPGYNPGYTASGANNIDYINQLSLPMKNKLVAGLLGIILGGFGIHKFYLGQKILGIIYLLFCWTYIPGIIGFIEGIVILAMSDEKFKLKYKCRLE